ncbi:hypothetical protein PINS_up014418 [Pythium insidiosum]|nr:hypothetical protein PINS_up014418 [Pythium insidiosum]
MRVLALFALCCAALADSSRAAIAADDRQALVAELLAWKNSPAGQDAARMGLIPAPPAHRRLEHAAADITEDELERLQESKKRIAALQQQQPKAILSLHTPFALMKPNEFKAFVEQSNVRSHRAEMQKSSLLTKDDPTQQNNPAQQAQQQLPKEVDWYKDGCVSPVKNQGTCGVCWVFAAIGALESGYCINSGKKTLLQLSEQEVVSCGPNQGQCRGGWAYVAYDWIIKNNGGGVCTEESYKYDPYNTGTSCRRFNDPTATCDKRNLDIVAYVANQYPDHKELEKVVARHPVAAQVMSGVGVFQFYGGGVLFADDNLCPSNSSDHEVMIVGYGEKNSTAVWKIKNSWGTYWGEEGFGYLERGSDKGVFGTCGIESWSYYPVFKNQAPWTDNLRCGPRRSGIELIGQELKTVSTRSADLCCDACRRERGCKAATWSSKTPDKCRLLSTVEGEKNLGNWWEATSFMVVPKTESRCLPVENNVDYVGNDLMQTQTKTAGECCDQCSQTAMCGAYTWSKYNGGSCWLKYRKYETKAHTPLPDGTPYFQSGEIYQCQPLQQDTDLPGEDFDNKPAKTASECCSICHYTYPCKAFSWSNYQGGTCWLKKSASTGVRNPGVISATIY